ncbi:hypothetical protein RUND412_004048 [Rhizina undulata]
MASPETNGGKKRSRKRITALDMWDSYPPTIEQASLTSTVAGMLEQSVENLDEEDVAGIFQRAMHISVPAAKLEGHVGAKNDGGERELEVPGSSGSPKSTSPIMPVDLEVPVPIKEYEIRPASPPSRRNAPSVTVYVEPSTSPRSSLLRPIGPENILLSENIQGFIATETWELEGLAPAGIISPSLTRPPTPPLADYRRFAENPLGAYGTESEEAVEGPVEGSVYGEDTDGSMEWESTDHTVLEVPRPETVAVEAPTSYPRHHEYSPAVQAWFAEIKADREHFAAVQREWQQEREYSLFQQRLVEEQRQREEKLLEERREKARLAAMYAYYSHPYALEPEGPKATPIGPIRTRTTPIAKRWRAVELRFPLFGYRGQLITRTKWVWC